MSTTYSDVIQEQEVPVVAIDEGGIFTYVNSAFTKVYGWSKEDLLGEVITKIIPHYMRDAHNFGFSRFLITQEPRILGKPVALPTLCKDETIKNAEHLIVGEKQDGKWQFAAIITPL